jgi:hypothetical protein
VTDWPRVFDISAAIAREAMSTAPPGGNGQISLIGLEGKVWA